MPGYDGNGNFVRVHNWTADAANGLDINASEMDAEENNVAAGLSNAVTRDGQGKPSADFLPNADNTLNLGSGPLRWKALNVVSLNATSLTGTIVSTDVSYVQSAAEVTVGVTPTNLFYPPGTVDRYGTNTTPGTTDMTAAINAATSVASTGGLGYVNFLAATYAHASTLVWKNNVVYQGAGCAVTILKYTGVADQIQVNNPINSSTLANYDVRDLWLQATSANVGKANFADVGSTFAVFRRVRFSGAMIGLILDQSELVRGYECLFQDIVANANAAGVWIVNGAEHTGGANAGFTNEILFQGCQFNPSGGVSTVPVLVADDGGQSHKFKDCNFNAGSSSVRLNGASGVLVQGCELEGCGTGSIDLYTTKWGGAAGAENITVTVDTCTFSTGAVKCVRASVASAIRELRVTNNLFTTSGAVFDTTGVSVELFAQGNEQGGAGDGRFLINNYFSDGTWTISWTSSVGTPALGNGTLTGKYSRKGKEFILRMNFVAGSTTTFGTAGGVFSFSTPIMTANDGINFLGTVRALCAGVVPTQGMILMGNNASTFTVINGSATGSWGQGTPGTWTTNDFIQCVVSGKAANWLG